MVDNTIFDNNFKKNFKIEGWMSPTTIVSVVDNKRYAISGSNWIHVPSDMTFDEIKNGFVDLRKRRRESSSDIYKEVKSSKSKTTYRVSFTQNTWRCTCSGFNFRRKCSHIDEVKSDLKKLF